MKFLNREIFLNLDTRLLEVGGVLLFRLRCGDLLSRLRGGGDRLRFGRGGVLLFFMALPSG